MLNISSSRSIIRTGYTTYYMIASYLIISLSLLHIPLVSLFLSLSLCVCVNVVHSLIIIKTKDERRIFSYWPSYVSQCRLTTERRRRKKKHTTSTNERDWTLFWNATRKQMEDWGKEEEEYIGEHHQYDEQTCGWVLHAVQ